MQQVLVNLKVYYHIIEELNKNKNLEFLITTTL